MTSPGADITAAVPTGSRATSRATGLAEAETFVQGEKP